jgi:limonene-1,2-epoxide hydrolase
MLAIERFVSLYQDLDQSSISQLSNVYASSICFVDPVTTHTGIHQVANYFAQLLDNTNSCQCTVTRILTQGNQYMVRWEMCFSNPRLRKGETIRVDGVSEITIEQDKIVYQRDFYDLGEMVYQHIPILGWLINKIKKGLAQ